MSASFQKTVPVSLADRSYEIAIVTDQLAAFAETLSAWEESRQIPLSHTALVVTDRNVEPHAKVVRQSLMEVGWSTELIALEPGEKSKRLAVTETMYDRLVEMKADRQTLVIAVGGGVVGDAAGFVAATWTRGVPFVQVPTSLLAHVDSSVGGKVGINHPQGKNLIGAFHQPLGVFIDTATLQTLPERDYRSGLAEVIKYGVILDADFFAYLESHIDGLNTRDPAVMRHIIARSCQLKAEVVQEDEFERTGLRAVLNYGHTFAHAFEALCSYEQLLHGEAVAIGMLYASRLAERLKRIDTEVTQRQHALIEAVGLPTQLPEGSNFGAAEIIDRMKLDKKTVAGQLRFVLPAKMGHVEVVKEVPIPDVEAVLE